ncbi:putative ArsR family transcriptional regulator [Nocardioides thalensis]|uniref:Putative ArsR family transcriptional regulator n=1 Tax=Nocardioides thalensis TaxID=1914755 RepID=A0A853C5L0_9ACTN|nr:helix-turn-helix domain-containing protein [Nocardioides thalensis]NYJ01788.1 putative ArsR family transcriptional regulator [Nocardioides thalensis]
MELGTKAAGIGALADDTRRALYEYVVAQPEPVGREQAASALDIAQHNVNFHLDKLVAEGLLEVEYRRLSGRSGPGAGRPSKLYRRAAQEFAVSLPPRRYDLVGDILAAAVTRAADGVALPTAMSEVAREEGRALGDSAEGIAADAEPLAAVAQVLAIQGYEPRIDVDEVLLSNCPFDSLARKHTELVCGLNHDFVQGVVDGLGYDGVRACLEPGPDQCCVKARAEAGAPE